MLPVLNLCKIPHKNATRPFCDTYIRDKLHQLPFHNFNTKYTSPLELVFIAIWGLTPIHATCGARYYVAFLDAYFCYT